MYKNKVTSVTQLVDIDGSVIMNKLEYISQYKLYQKLQVHWNLKKINK